MKFLVRRCLALIIMGIASTALFAGGGSQKKTSTAITNCDRDAVNCNATVSGIADVKTAISNCGPNALNCNATTNAVGDALELNVSAKPVTDWGIIETMKRKNIILPKEAGAQTVYSFTPTTGESKDTLIYIVFDNIKQIPGSKYAGKTLIKIYRRFSTDNKPTAWTEVGKIVLGIPTLKDKKDTTTSFVIKPDGTGVWWNPENGEPTLFFAGKKDLKSVNKEFEQDEIAAVKKAAAEHVKQRAAMQGRQPAGVPTAATAVAAAAA